MTGVGSDKGVALDYTVQAAMAISVSVVVPAYREAPNIEPLTRRVFDALPAARFDAELIFVDDNSGDGSVEIAERLAAEYAVRILVRTDARGLASAVLHGFEHAEKDVLVVMDGDLQHPPEAIPDLVEAVARDGADLAVGSRYVAGGDIVGEWSFLRNINSLGATLLARPLVRLRDPMSGFCALRRETWRRAAKLNPVGYKITLELAVKARCKRCVEIPISFGMREAGSSKLSLTEQLRYVEHLSRLYWFRFKWPIIGALVVAAAAITVIAGTR